MFVDRVEIDVKAGRGGDGCISFRREKHVPRGGPDGGNGGRGGDVIVRADPHMRTLLDLRHKKRYSARSGRHGQGARKNGRGGEESIIVVPPGTVIEDAESGKVLADITEGDQEVVVAKGGAGGKGNYVFRSSTNQAPRINTEGRPGEERRLRFTLKLIADVGLVGLPNAGKSTLLRSVSKAHTIVAPYPFSTIEPVLGIVPIDEAASFCMVDIPGLIEGAHRGKGLGIRFLQHIERCRILLFLIDAAGPVPPHDAYRQLRAELRLYSEKLEEKPAIIALNKIDMLERGKGRLDFPDNNGSRVFEISALAGMGLDELTKALYVEVSSREDKAAGS